MQKLFNFQNTIQKVLQTAALHFMFEFILKLKCKRKLNIENLYGKYHQNMLPFAIFNFVFPMDKMNTTPKNFTKEKFMHIYKCT